MSNITSSIIEITTSQPLSYPRMLRSKNNGVIVMFYEEGSGVVLHSDYQNEPIGKYSSDWYMEYFEEFDGAIEIDCTA